MFKYYKIILYSLILLSFFGSFHYSSAYSIRFDNPYTLGEVKDIIKDLACWIDRLGFLLIIIFIILTGIKMISAGPKPEKFKEATQAFKNVLIGGMVILGVGIIISTITYNIGVPFPVPIICNQWF